MIELGTCLKNYFGERDIVETSKIVWIDGVVKDTLPLFTKFYGINAEMSTVLKKIISGWW